MVFYDITTLTYKVKDLGAGVGTFLKCPAIGIDDETPGIKLNQDSIV